MFKTCIRTMRGHNKEQAVSELESIKVLSRDKLFCEIVTQF